MIPRILAPRATLDLFSDCGARTVLDLSTEKRLLLGVSHRVYHCVSLSTIPKEWRLTCGYNERVIKFSVLGSCTNCFRMQEQPSARKHLPDLDHSTDRLSVCGASLGESYDQLSNFCVVTE